MNLCIGDIFKKSSVITTLAEQAVTIVNFFNQLKVWMGKLCEEQALIYKNKYYALIIPNKTR